MYSHDTFGLGHLRRCRTIAHALVERISGLQVLIISGSSITGAFDFRVRVDFVKIPSVIKLHSGEYKSMSDHIDIDETIEMRSSMIRDTARSFKPDIMIVDKEPLGLRGEMEDTLLELKAAGTCLVLGMRDVMDSPELLKREWAPKDMITRIDEIYDHVWVYGPHDFYEPLTGMDVPQSLDKRITYTGFLRRSMPQSTMRHERTDKDFILVTTGGGGDGAAMLKNVIAGYEYAPEIPLDALMVLGPFMPATERDIIYQRAEATGRIQIIEFDALIEKLIVESSGLVGMGGYNTFCEMLSFGKPSLIIPRRKPRREQFVRASRASELVLARMLHPDDAENPKLMAEALSILPEQPVPSRKLVTSMMGGLTKLCDITQQIISDRASPDLSVVKGGLQ